MNTKKQELIQRFAESLERNCQDEQQVQSLIVAIETMSDFFCDQQKKSLSWLPDLYFIKQLVSEYSSEEMLRSMEDCFDMSTVIIAHANCMTKEADLLFEICNDLK